MGHLRKFGRKKPNPSLKAIKCRPQHKPDKLSPAALGPGITQLNSKSPRGVEGTVSLPLQAQPPSPLLSTPLVLYSNCSPQPRCASQLYRRVSSLDRSLLVPPALSWLFLTTFFWSFLDELLGSSRLLFPFKAMSSKLYPGESLRRRRQTRGKLGFSLTQSP